MYQKLVDNIIIHLNCGFSLIILKYMYVYFMLLILGKLINLDIEIREVSTDYAN